MYIGSIAPNLKNLTKWPAVAVGSIGDQDKHQAIPDREHWMDLFGCGAGQG